MTESLLVSHYVLWALVLVLSGVVLVLTRQVGILHERIAPAGALALSTGPEVGGDAPALEVAALDGRRHRIGRDADRDRSLLLFFMSPSCPTCLALHGTARRLASQHRADLLLASDGDELDHESFVASHGLSRSEYVVSQPLGMAFQVSKLPYAVLVDASGVVRAQGLVNTREHLESLFEAEALGVASIQEYLQTRDTASADAQERAHGLG